MDKGNTLARGHTHHTFGLWILGTYFDIITTESVIMHDDDDDEDDDQDLKSSCV